MTPPIDLADAAKELGVHLVPLGKPFLGIEGETYRVGELTAFVPLLNAPFVPLSSALTSAPVARAATVVLDVCECTWFPWEPAATAWNAAVNRCWSDKRTILETRGEVVPASNFGAYYLLYTPGVTLVKTWASVARTENVTVKVLLGAEQDLVREARTLLVDVAPFLAENVSVYVYPRVGWGFDDRERLQRLWNEWPDVIAAFGDLPRLMLVEHEVVGAP